MDNWADRKLQRRLHRELLRATREEWAFAWEMQGGWRGALALWGRTGTPPFFAAFRDRSGSVSGRPDSERREDSL